MHATTAPIAAVEICDCAPFEEEFIEDVPTPEEVGIKVAAINLNVGCEVGDMLGAVLGDALGAALGTATGFKLGD